MADIDERLRELSKHRRTRPASIAVMETHVHAERVHAHRAEPEMITLRAAACWDGELDPIDAFSQLSDLHEKAQRAEHAARRLRLEIERINGWNEPPPRE